jgi:hypothetical protein
VTFLIYFSQNTLTSTPGTASTTSFGSTTNKKSAAKPTKEISGRIPYLRRPVKQLRKTSMALVPWKFKTKQISGNSNW